MQLKTIEKILRSKIKDWTNSISDEKLREDVFNSTLVSGGSICSLLLNEDVNDYDVYLQDASVAKRLAEYYIKPHKELEVWCGSEKESLVNHYYNGNESRLNDDNYLSICLGALNKDQIKIFVNTGEGGFKVPESFKVDKNGDRIKYAPSYFSPNAISLTDDLQIVIRFTGDAETIHKTFDFVHATNYWTAKSGLVTRKSALESIITRTLSYQGSLYPITSIIRVKKFVGRKWKIGAGEMLKMIYQSSLLDLNNFDVLEEQLIGVDVAYFSQLISILREKKIKDKDFSITPDYMNTLIDRVFGDSDFDN